MLGYYKNPEATKEVIDSEGFMHTGDIGHLVDGKYLKITDRKKEIFKLSLGKYVAPQVIENLLKESPFIQNCIVIGENQKFASAIIVPDFERLHFWAAKHSINYVNSKTSPHENIKREKIVCDEWTTANNMLSQTLKLKRARIMSRYAGLVNEIYK